ncbi:hypothetical protein FIBSPDRAFT_1044688 [Athelia psychrophila]|uniref:DUF6533 domain-containing protein n=1 Tax=Athelia psychrophila TaxID=1759441 RepID=A0A166J9Z1_9AGAM|nr:hypothetical protein FIBSPDRAFT_1044688 [Fibularhizoctonia sp. CBS 109695]
MLVSVDLAAAGLQSLQFTATGYGSVVILTAFLYDWLLSIATEVRSVQKTGLNLPISAYYLSRTCSLTYCMCVFITELSIVKDDDQIEYTKFAVWWAASAATSLLFFFRVYAVYKHSRPIRILFSFLWIIIITSPAAIVYTVHDPCTTSSNSACNFARPLSLISNGTMCINDTLVFILVSREMYSNSAIEHRPGVRDAIGVFFGGKGMYNISKSVLRSSQLYYGVTIGFQLSATFTFFLGTRYAGLIGLSYIALSSCMACRVFRMVLLCDTVPDNLNTAIAESVLRSASVDNDLDRELAAALA